MDYQSIITFFMEMAGTVAFAASGAMVGVERNMDIFGVSVLGVVTAVGGGMIRDIVLGIIPPNVFTNPVYALVATITSCVVFLAFYWKRQLLEGHMRLTYDRVMLVMDSIGLGIFTVVGVNTGIRSGYMDNVFLLVFLGTITGVGGGLMRDMMAGVPPYIFVKHIYACASIVGAVVCVYMNRFVGNVEARDLMDGVADVIVTDGFTGNAVLKTMEGTALGLFKQLKTVLSGGGLKAKIGAFLLKNDLRGLKKTLDYSDVGGAVLFGLQAPVVKTHGSSDAKAVYSTIRQIRTMLETDVIRKSVVELSELEEEK